MADIPVVAIDGPGGAGKGTISRNVAAALGWHLLDSGALYRSIGLEALRTGIDLDAEDQLADLARSLDVEFDAQSDSERILIRGRDVAADLRTEACGEAASRIASQPRVREALVEKQRAFRQLPGLLHRYLARWSKGGRPRHDRTCP